MPDVGVADTKEEPRVDRDFFRALWSMRGYGDVETLILMRLSY
jgi:hypothetical protein